VDAGKLHILATATPRRTSRHPDVPSAREAGFPTMNISTWWALAAPRGTPKPVVDRLYAATQAGLKSVKERYEQLGFVPIGNRPDELAAQIAAESAAWGSFIRNRNIRID
jgi:tripartite-type tricarboxylate transporter receptor subunit TctC